MEGLTIFTKFKSIPEIMGKNIFSLQEKYENLPKKQQKEFRGHLQAVQALCNRLTNAKNE